MNQADFLYGAGLMGVLAGIGIGSKHGGNKLALLLGGAALFFAHQEKPLIDIAPRPELEDARRSLPTPSIPDLPNPFAR